MTVIHITRAGINLYQTTAGTALYLNSISGMTKSITEAGKEAFKECMSYDLDEEW